MTDRKKPEPYPDALLLGDPVDPKRPLDMTREQYQRARPGSQTQASLKALRGPAVTRPSRILWLLLAAGIALAAALALSS